MEKRRLGTSDLEITPVVLGAWAIGGSMWGGQNERDAIAAIHASLDQGINLIDTAAVYGTGASEEIVGKALRDRRDRDRTLVATKCGLIWDSTDGTFRFEMIDVDGRPRAIHHDMRPQAVRAGCEASLRRLERDVIDLYQIHWPDPGIRTEDSFGELLALRDEGKIRWIGVSNFSAEQLRVAKGVAGIVSDQPQYNLLDRGIEAEVLPLCRQEQVGVISYSPMARGLLSGKFGAEHHFAANDHRGGLRWFKPETLPRVQAALERARPMASAYGVSLANLAVAWVTSAPGITAAIVGARDAAQAVENARAADIRLSDGDRATLSELFAGL
jgi:aryl-alcohol dehydrogenase-like predicted oxidoreductase